MVSSIEGVILETTFHKRSPQLPVNSVPVAPWLTINNLDPVYINSMGDRTYNLHVKIDADTFDQRKHISCLLILSKGEVTL
jgi:hypothetical protein